ncbi:MAG: ribosome recycling factor [Candidatus Levybacteria bacterium]|nr:ribosome recycling factor [Candidatus Levybacteria bacterium]
MNPDLLNQTKQKMQKVLEVIRIDLGTVRTGRATPSLVENISINAYGGPPAGGSRLKILELATIHSSDSQTLIITPFDASIIGEISKGILEVNVGLTPVIDGAVIRISIPPLSEERRQQLIHLMKQKLEGGKIQVRQMRHEAMSEIKKKYNDKEISEDDLLHLEKGVQKETDAVMEQIDEMGKRKEEELMQI